MLVIDNGDAIRGIAEVASKLDFIVSGYIGTTATQLADGQLSNAEADLYASGADATVVTSITVVNTDSAARTFTLYLKPSAGTSRAISPVSLDLPAYYSFYTDGQRMIVMSQGGKVVQTCSAHKDSHDPQDGADPLDTANAAEISVVVAAGIGTSHSLARADHIHAINHAITDNHLATIDGATNAPVNGDYAKFTANGLEGMAKAQILSDLNVADGADVTGSNAPQAHKDLHDPIDGSDKLDTAIPVKVAAANAIGNSHSFSRANHVHEREHAKYTDAAAKAAAVQAGAITNGVTKAPTHDAVYDVKTIADAALPAGDKYTDAEAKAAAVQAGAITNAVTKAPTHDAVFDVKTTADAAQPAATDAAAAVTAMGAKADDNPLHHDIYELPANNKYATITFIIDGGGSAITTGQKGHLSIPFTCGIIRVTMLADQTGSIVVDIWKDTYANFPPDNADSITASAPPTISSAQKSDDTVLTGWTKIISSLNILAFNVDSCTTIQRVTISLMVLKS